MSTLRSYLSAILLVTCTFVTIPNQAMAAKNLLSQAISSLPSIQNISNFATQAKNTAIKNYYIVAPALVVTVIGSYSYIKKCFFGRKTVTGKPIKKQKPISQKISVKPVKATEPEKITNDVTTSDTEQASDTEQVTDVEQIAEQEQTAPVLQPSDDNKENTVIKVINSHDQSLDFTVSSVDDNDDVTHQFSVPGHKKGTIKIK